MNTALARKQLLNSEIVLLILFLSSISREFRTKMDKEYYRLEKEEKAKNKSLQFQLQSLDIRLTSRYDPKKIYAYRPDILTSKMIHQLPEEIVLVSNKSK